MHYVWSYSICLFQRAGSRVSGPKSHNKSVTACQLLLSFFLTGTGRCG